MGNGQDDEPIQIILGPQRGCPIALFFLVIIAMTIWGANPCFAESQRCPSPTPYEHSDMKRITAICLTEPATLIHGIIIKYIPFSEKGDWVFLSRR